MKINWKVRLKNPVFIAQVGAAVAVPVLAYMGLTVQDITSWPMVGNVILDAVKNPYILGLVAVSVFNAVQDPTTAGIGDSNQALGYKKPKGEKENE